MFLSSSFSWSVIVGKSAILGLRLSPEDLRNRTKFGFASCVRFGSIPADRLGLVNSIFDLEAKISSVITFFLNKWTKLDSKFLSLSHQQKISSTNILCAKGTVCSSLLKPLPL